MTYMELYEASNRFGRAIYDIVMKKTYSHKSNDWVIGMGMKPSHRAIIVMLAIWKMGGAYLSFNLEYQSKRMSEILNEVKPRLVIFDNDVCNQDYFDGYHAISFKELTKLADDYSSNYLIDDDTLTFGRGNLAMIFYSSTVLKEPKGTRIHHANCQQRLEWQWHEFPYAENETHCISHNALFHIDHFAEIWSPLCSGKCLIIMRHGACKQTKEAIDLMEKYNVMRFYALPSTIEKVLEIVSEIKQIDGIQKLINVKLWISSGEELCKNVAESFFDHYDDDGEHQLANFYGCTETTGESSTYVLNSRQQLDELEKIPIGRPVYNTHIYLLDANKQPVMNGQPGEIYVSGLFLSQSYVGNSDTCEEFFIRNPFHLLPAYWWLFKTGDYGRVENGVIYYDGRKDRKARVHNQSVDVDEIESLLKSFYYVEQAIVIPYKHKLIGFVLLIRNMANKSERGILKDLQEKLPVFAIPKVMLIHKMLYTDEGAIDVNQLLNKYKELDHIRRRRAYRVTIDYDQIPIDQQEIATTVFDVIGCNIGRKDAITTNSNFFDIGGNSMNLVSTVDELRDAGYFINIGDFLNAKDLNEVLDKIIPLTQFSSIETTMFSIEKPLEWRIAMVVREDFDICSELIVDCYIKKHQLLQYVPNLKKEHILKFLQNNCTIFVEKRLSFKVVDLRTEEIIGVALNIDADDERYLDMSDLESMDTIFEYLAFLEQDFE